MEQNKQIQNEANQKKSKKWRNVLYTLLALFFLGSVINLTSLGEQGNTTSQAPQIEEIKVDDTQVTEETKENKNADEVIKSERDEHAIMSYVIAQGYVKNTLKSPSSADFPFFGEGITIEPNVYSVTSYVDSQNSFGAKIRTNWEMKLEYKGGEGGDPNNWEVLKYIVNGEKVYPLEE